MKSQRGFTFLEILITVSVLGLLAAVAVLAVGSVVSSSHDHKLESDVASLNRAVVSYIASGGDLSDSGGIPGVLDALKRSPESSRVPGITGAKLDPSVSAVMQSPAEISSRSPRVYWDEEARRFFIARVGNEPGVKAFFYDRDLAEQDFGTSERHSPLLYAENSDWIWDYVEMPVAHPPGASEVPLGEPVPSSPPPAPPSGSTPPSSTGTPLTSPQFSIPGGDYPISDFALLLALTNPNPLGSSEIYYSIDYGDWSRYDGPFNVAPGSNIAAQSISVSPEYDSSPRADEAYQALPLALDAPEIESSRDAFGIFTERNATITITNPNSSSFSEIEYRIESGPWQEYTHPFDVSRDQHPLGLRVEARAIPTVEHYTESDASSKFVGIEPLHITGLGEGSFHTPTGPSGMITNLTGGSISSYIEWGRDYFTSAELSTFNPPSSAPALSKSWMRYDPIPIDTVTTNDSFQIATLTYYNGTIVNGTEARAVAFRVDFDLTLQGHRKQVAFNFDFELINTVDRGIDPWEDADYVRISNVLAKETIEIDGVEFQLQIEFGETSAAGFAAFNEFHVLEQHQASTRLYATLVEVGSAVTTNP